MHLSKINNNMSNVRPFNASIDSNRLRETAYTWIAVAFSIGFLLVGLFNPLGQLISDARAAKIWSGLTDVAVIGVIFFYVWGQLIYEWCRIGFLRCFSEHRPATRERLESIYDSDQP